AFLVLRTLNVYGDPHPWHADRGSTAATLMSFLGTTKYPPSLLYLLMTLGPAAIVCAFAERVPGPIRQALLTFGRAPLAFYVVHFYLIHALSMLLGIAQGFAATQFLTHYRFYPKGFGLALPGVYVVWIAVVVALYPLCRWVTALKARRQDWWLSYVGGLPRLRARQSAREWRCAAGMVAGGAGTIRPPRSSSCACASSAPPARLPWRARPSPLPSSSPSARPWLRAAPCRASQPFSSRPARAARRRPAARPRAASAPWERSRRGAAACAGCACSRPGAP